MKKFMGNSSGSSNSNNVGFYDESQMGSKVNKLPFGQSSPSSCSQHNGLLHLNNLQQQQQQRESQDDNDDDMDHVVRRGSMDGTGTGCSNRDVAVIVDREHMFDKVVTPSDVGKLNRLVIPKQHAERFFPLDSSTNEKGLLLNFEDRNGKQWQFRYSYWNSSQSYVMTKGWSRFVKDKKLDAGDIVSFQRGVGELGNDRLFIDWKRRHEPPELPLPSVPTLSLPHQLFPNYHHPSIIHPWNNLMYFRPPPPISYSHGGPGPYANYSSFINPSSSSVMYFRSQAASGGPAVPPRAALTQQQVGMVQVQRRETGVEAMVLDSMPVSAHGKAAAKKLRLFGVNMECPMSESDEETQFSSSSSSSNPSHHLRTYYGTPIQTVPSELQFNKGKSSMSLDLDI